MNEIQCPWCANDVVLVDHICPHCRHEVLEEHLRSAPDDADKPQTLPFESETGAGAADMAVPIELDIEETIAQSFKCSKCGHRECRVKEVAMSGTGLSKILDIEHNHYLFVSCTHCAFVEVYDPDILRGYKSGKLGTVMDLLFGH